MYIYIREKSFPKSIRNLKRKVYFRLTVVSLETNSLRAITQNECNITSILMSDIYMLIKDNSRHFHVHFNYGDPSVVSDINQHSFSFCICGDWYLIF